MAAKRTDNPDILDSRDDTPTLSAALRAAESARPEKKDDKSGDDKISVFWRVFGGTILSIVALVAITLFNNLHGTISELRAEVNKVQEKVPDLVKKDEFNTRLSTNYDRIQTLQTQNNAQNATLTSLRTEIDGLKDRLTRQQADADAARKEAAGTIEALKKDVAALDLLKERVTGLEGVKKELAVLEGLKERLVALSADLKGHREEYLKLRQDVDRNQAADQERKARRDEQYKDTERVMKELQLSIQDLQVKLARLEGQQNKTPAPKGNKAEPAPSPRTAGADGDE